MRITTDEAISPQPEVNIGLTGHVDHGKSTLVQALTGKWPATHSEELRRGITIKLGYANAVFRKCESSHYTTERVCPYCGAQTEALRKVSFVDCPGHESLMAIMLAGATIMDGAVLVIAADEPCPQPQTKEHLAALTISEVKNLVVVQNKIELVDDEGALKNYEQIVDFLTEAGFKDVPIIPVSALHKANIDVVIEKIEERIPTPQRDESADPLLFVARSFDINRPGTEPEQLQGGVIGGSVVQGKFVVGDEIEIRPGVKVGDRYRSLMTEIVEMQTENEKIEEAKPGGLVALKTNLDPSLTKSDNLMGNVVGRIGSLPPVRYDLRIEATLFKEVVGLPERVKTQPLREGEPIMITVGTATTLGKIREKRGGGIVNVDLMLPVCASSGKRVAIGRRVMGRWRLIGYGVIID